MATDLLVKSANSQSLDAFVGELPILIGCDRWEERESSNYFQGRYFRCIVLGLEITAAAADNDEFKRWPLWLYFEPHEMRIDDPRGLDGVAECVAITLAMHSYDVIRPNDLGRRGTGATRYRPARIKGLRPSQRIRISEI